MLTRTEGLEWKNKHKMGKHFVVRYKLLGLTVYKKVYLN